MKKIILIFITVVVVIWGAAYMYISKQKIPDSAPSVPVANTTSTPQVSSSSPAVKSYSVETYLDGLKVPWDIAFLPEGGMLVTERPGTLLYIKADKSIKRIPVPNVKSNGESGLLGVTLHPKYEENHYVYLDITQTAGSGLLTNVERYVFKDGQLSDRKIIVKNIPAALYHDGGRLEFGPDGFLYITAGDATHEPNAQDKNSLAGKILRVKDDGSIPADNPFKNAIYSYGHRNPQGLAWDSDGRLWSTEHGRSGALTGYDEINLISAGANYGWPTIEGDKTKSGMQAPIWQSGADDTWAPASALIIGDKLYFGGLRGEALFQATLDGGIVTGLKKFFFKDYGRIRTVRLGPDGYMYMTTSNTDGRGESMYGDDKILRINAEYFK